MIMTLVLLDISENLTLETLLNAETIINKQNRNNGKIEAIITNADQEEFEVTKKEASFRRKLL